MFRMYRGTLYQNHCGNGSIETSGPNRVFLSLVSLCANVISDAADYGLKPGRRKEAQEWMTGHRTES